MAGLTDIIGPGMVNLPERTGNAETGVETEAVGGRRSPLRRCIASGAIQGKEMMIRFVASPEGRLLPDLAGTLPGRGWWVSADAALLARAVARNLFAKAARRALVVDADLVVQVERGLARRCLDLLGLARRAGQLVAGHDQVHAALKTDRICAGRERSGAAVALVLAAADGAEDGRYRMATLAGTRPVIALFSAAELGAALGREHIVHVALAAGGLSQQVRAECQRLAPFRAPVTPPLPTGRRNPTGCVPVPPLGPDPHPSLDPPLQPPVPRLRSAIRTCTGVDLPIVPVGASSASASSPDEVSLPDRSPHSND